MAVTQLEHVMPSTTQPLASRRESTSQARCAGDTALGGRCGHLRVECNAPRALCSEPTSATTALKQLPTRSIQLHRFLRLIMPPGLDFPPS